MSFAPVAASFAAFSSASMCERSVVTSMLLARPLKRDCSSLFAMPLPYFAIRTFFIASAAMLGTSAPPLSSMKENIFANLSLSSAERPANVADLRTLLGMESMP